jgi:hypothetical protein
MNIKFEYLYRDAGNYKQHGEVVFSNKTKLSPSFVDENIKKYLFDNMYFYPNQLGLKSLHFFPWDHEFDHLFHEYVEVS